MSQRRPTGYLEQIIGVNCGKKVPLYNYDVTLGRSKTAYVNSLDPNVSRYHCVLKYSPSGWFIKDLGSVNGTYVENIRIPTDFVPLKSGSSIYFGPKEDAPEGYKFESVKSLSEQGFCEDNELRYCTMPSASSLLKSPEKNTLKRKVLSKEKKCTLDDISAPSERNRNKNYSDENYGEDGYHTDSSISSLDSLKTRIRKAKSAEKKKKEKRFKFYCQEELNGSVPSTSRKLFLTSEGCHERIYLQGSNSDGNGSPSLLVGDNAVDWKFDSNNCERPLLGNINSMFNVASENLNSDSVAVHSTLLKVLEKKVNDLQKTLKAVNLKFSDTLNENAKLVEIAKSREHSENKIREEILKITEEDLICNICTELFVKPITLGCSHTFCYYCIFEWKKKKKQCPICRKRIETETTVLYMDTYINKIMALLDPISLQKRIDLMQTRDELQKKKPKRKKPARSPYSRRRTVPAASASGISRLDRIREQVIDIQSYADDIRNYVDVMDEMMNEDDEDDEDVLHVAGYYGGYGQCYNCGRPGHWANACPI